MSSSHNIFLNKFVGRLNLNRHNINSNRMGTLATLKNLNTMKKLQKELDDKVDLEKNGGRIDLESLDYLNTVVNETLRLHPTTPLLLPYEAMKDYTIDGFHISKHACIFVNVCLIGRDPSVWIEAEKFIPERFEGSRVGLHGRDFELIPVGPGRRGCPSIQQGLTVVKLVLA